MPRNDRFSEFYAQATPELGARTITSFAGLLANDNASAGTPLPGPRRSNDFGLPAFAFLTGLGAAAMVTFAGHLFGLGG
jgi:hypothetical protein